MGKVTTAKFLFFCMLLWGGATNFTYGQANETVSGTVTSADNNEALPGVNIRVSGTTSGTSTDANGAYQLDVPALNDTLIFSYIGYQTQNVPINGRTSVNVQLKPETLTGQEVVVVGYGTQRRQDLTGSVSSVSSDQLENASISTPDQALQGRISGVDVHRNSNAPGGGISVNVRGTASLSAGGSPLYVVDGIPISDDFRTYEGGVNGNGGGFNPLNSIDPSDIASIQVLKDASATAIYGSQGANGVVLITTKQGISGHQQVELNTSIGISQINNKLDFMDAKSYAQQANTVATIQGNPPVFTDQEINNFGAGTDWQDAIFRNAVQQKYGLNVSGGSDNLQYLFSTNYTGNQGIILNTNLKRYATRLNLNSEVSKDFTIGANLSYTATDNNRVRTSGKGYGTQTNVTTELIEAPPTIPARDSVGNYAILSNYPLGSGKQSPLASAEGTQQFASTNRFIGNVNATYDIYKHLSAQVRIGADIRNWRYHQYYPIGSPPSGGQHGSASQINEHTVNFVDNNTLTYQQNFNNIHDINVVAGLVFRREKDESLSGSAQNFPSDFFSYNNLGAGSDPLPPGSGVSRWTKLSYLGRVNYSLYNKYLFTASYRVDGNSKFGANKKYGSFPAVSVGWRLGDENFMKDVSAISHLKFKAGWGKTGNASIGDYAALSLVGRSFSIGNGYAYNGTLQPVAYPNGLANPDLTWEKSTGFNYGVDIGFIKDRLTLSGTYYHKKSKSLLLNVPLPRQSGYGSVLKNAGSILNKGFSFELSSANVQSNSFNWNTDLNISHNENKILSLGGADYIYTGWAGGGNIHPHGRQAVRLQAGHSVGAFYGSVYEGIWHSQEEIDNAGTMPSAHPGEARFKDVNGDGKYDTNDDIFLGNPNPKLNFGITNDFNYKNLSLHVFIYGKYGNDVLNLPAQRFLYNGSGTAAKRVGNSWTPETPNNPLPGRGKPSREYSALVEDGSFLRVQNVSLNYNIPVDKWNWGTLNQLQIGVAADNLAIITNYSGYDPEVNSYGYSNSVKGIDRYAYPASRSFRFNLKIKF